jgi:hypothetical protein
MKNLALQDVDLRDAPATIATIKIEARVQRGSSREQYVGLQLTLRANQTPAEIAEDVTALCKQIRDEVNGIMK